MHISEMAWGVTLWFDLWCCGIASASFLTAFVINKLCKGTQNILMRAATYTGIVFAFIGVILLLSHLGHIEWFWHMFVMVRPESVLSLGGWILSFWLMVTCIMAVLWVAKFFFNKLKSEGNKSVLLELCDKLTGILSWVGMVFSLLLITYGGVLLATTSQPLWADTLLLPAIFVSSAMCTGLGWLVLASFIMNKLSGVSWMRGVSNLLFGTTDIKIDGEIISKMVKTLVIVLIITLVILAVFAIWLAIVANEAFTVLVAGEMALYFWIGLVLIGLVSPLVLLILNQNKDISNSSITAVIAASASLVVIGGLILRAVILVSAQL
jgi:polysulfide reductase chain C